MFPGLRTTRVPWCSRSAFDLPLPINQVGPVGIAAVREWPINLSPASLIGDKDDYMTAAAVFHIRGLKFDSRRIRWWN
ncbi:MAG: hypothetical protein HY543_04270 [Deltaproteobacteria bacterium]|nr:hypothetical protein [Deltaproteobacteria bacterium]